MVVSVAVNVGRISRRVRLREASASEPSMNCRKRFSCHVPLHTRMDETAPIDSAALFGSSFWVDDVKTGGDPSSPLPLISLGKNGQPVTWPRLRVRHYNGGKCHQTL